MTVRAIKLPHYYVVCYELPCSTTWAWMVQIKAVLLMLMQAYIVQCFCLSSVVGRGNVLVSQYLWPKSISDTLSITLLRSIGDNCTDI